MEAKNQADPCSFHALQEAVKAGPEGVRKLADDLSIPDEYMEQYQYDEPDLRLRLGSIGASLHHFLASFIGQDAVMLIVQPTLCYRGTLFEHLDKGQQQDPK